MSQTSAADRPAMKTIGGMSVRKEIDVRLETSFQDGHRKGIEDALAFLRQSGHVSAAADLNEALNDAVARLLSTQV